MCFFFFSQKTAYEMRISDWSSDVCSSDLTVEVARVQQVHRVDHHRHVRGVLAGGVGELLDRADRIGVQHLLPAVEVLALPVAVRAAHVGLAVARDLGEDRSEEHTSELQSLMRISYAVFCL